MKSINLKENQFIQFHQKISFKFDGVKYFGYKGDTIASALLRNNINLVGRSFKYHRPRGIYTCGIEEPNALVQIISEYSEPNTRATIKKIYEGMEFDSQTDGLLLKTILEVSITYFLQFLLLVFTIKHSWGHIRNFGKICMNHLLEEQLE